MKEREKRYISELIDEGISAPHAIMYIQNNRTRALKYNLKYTFDWLRKIYPEFYENLDNPVSDYKGMETEPTLDEQHLNTGSSNMNINHTISALQEFNTVSVRFSDTSKTYTYKTKENFEAGDKAIVNPNGMLKVVTVIDVHETPQIDFGSNIEYKWIVQKVDTRAYEAILAQEEAIAVELRKSIAAKKRKEVKQELLESLGYQEVSKLQQILEPDSVTVDN